MTATAQHTPAATQERRDLLARRIRLFVTITIAWNVTAGVAVKEGLEAWRGDNCCAPGAALHLDAGTAEDDGCGCGPGCTDACCTDTNTTKDAVHTAAPLLTIGRRPNSDSDQN